MGVAESKLQGNQLESPEKERTESNSLLKTSADIEGKLIELMITYQFDNHNKFSKKQWLPTDEVILKSEAKKAIDEEIKKNRKYFHKKKDVSLHPGLLPKMLGEREFCGLCMEYDYCSHEIKIEALKELKEGMGLK